MGMTYKQKIEEAKNRGIQIPEELASGEEIVGVYGFFSVNEKNEEECFYIGKATDIAYRILGAGGHVYRFLHDDFSKLVPLKMKEYLKKNCKIEVKILDKIDYSDTSYSRAAHRLAFAEIKRIVEYQEKDQCLFQEPEGSRGKNYWEKHYKK